VKSDALYLADITERIRRILSSAADGREAFLASTEKQDSILHNLQLLGESVRRVSDDEEGVAARLASRHRHNFIGRHAARGCASHAEHELLAARCSGFDQVDVLAVRYEFDVNAWKKSQAVSDRLRDRYAAVGSDSHDAVFYRFARSTAFAKSAGSTGFLR
jgi:hypothetical protein